jgi:argininosuccinate synthase
VEVQFERGTPVSFDGQSFAPVALLSRLNEIGGRHGLGRSDWVELRSGKTTRGVCESPGGAILNAAQRALEALTLEPEQILARDALIPEYAGLAYRGEWFSERRNTLQAQIDELQQTVSGVVRLRLFKGAALVVGRKAGGTDSDES